MMNFYLPVDVWVVFKTFLLFKILNVITQLLLTKSKCKSSDKYFEFELNSLSLVHPVQFSFILQLLYLCVKTGSFIQNVIVVKELRSKMFRQLPVQVNMNDIQATTKGKYYDHI